MQSTEAQEARAKTSTSRTSSTRSNEDQPQHITITIDGMDCNITEATQPMVSASTQTWTSEPNTNQESPIVSQTIGAKKRRYYARHITEIRIFPDHQADQSNPQQSEAQQHDLLGGTRKAPWTPHQSYDVKGCANFHKNSEGVVLTSPSSHPYCAYCRTTSHPRSTCPMRSKLLAKNTNRLYHPEKGIARSNNERRRCNKFPDEPPVANHNITGTSKIRAQSIYNIAVHPSKHFKPPNYADKFVNDKDKSCKPNYWSIDGQLIVSQTRHALCGYCGIPSHSREICRLRLQDKVGGKFYNSHPNQGKILSKNQSTKQLQPAEGASYRTFKKHSYYNKDRARSIQLQSTQVNGQDEDNNGWDYNHNPLPQNRDSVADPAQYPKAEVQPKAATPKRPTKYRAKWATITISVYG